jgi:DHA1 family multidrug resistance protein-like MFS transporter
LVVSGKLLNRLIPKSLPAVYYYQTAIVFAIMMGMSLPSSFLPIMAQDLDPSGVLVGMVVSAWFLSRIFLDLPAGVLSDRFGRRRLLTFGIGLSLFGPILCAFATNIYILILGRAIWGVGSAFYFMNVYALLMDILPSSVRGRSLGFFQGLEYTGNFLGAPIGAFLATYASFSHVFYFSLIMTFASLVIALRSGRMKETEARGSDRTRASLREVIGSLKSWGIIVVCLCSFLRYFINAGIFGTVFQLFLNNGLLYSIEAIGIVLSVRIVGQVVSIIVAGILSDKVGRVPVLIVGYMFSASAFFVFTLVNDFGAMLLIAMLQGVGEGFGFTTLIALLTDLSPPNIRGGVVGIFRTFNDIGGFVGPIAFVLIYGGSRSANVFYICVVLNMICMALMLTLRARHNLIPIPK